MFTGIVEMMAPVRSSSETDLWLDVPFAGDLRIGQSVSCSGVCLTVVELDERGFRVEVMGETRERTFLAELKAGHQLNVERAMRADGRLDGHIVQGHVDGVGKIVGLDEQRSDDESLDSLLVTIEFPQELSKYMVEKGSVCIDGISLTIVNVSDDQLTLGIIPHTWEITSLQHKQLGDPVHLEVDVLAKYVERILSFSPHGHDHHA